MDNTEFQKASSLLRHGKFKELHELLNQPDCAISVDHTDEHGNTLLHISAQNGNKRMVKLCLRYGAHIDARNNNGQTALHFAVGYGFQGLGEYLVQKGADDSLRNRFGLTCYEGLREDSVKRL